EARAGGDLPYLHGPVGGRRGEKLAVWAERHRVDSVAVISQRAHVLAGGHVPELDQPVVTTGRQGLAVGAEGQVVNYVLVGGDDLLRLVRRGAGGGEEVDPDFAEAARGAAGHRE